MSQLNALEKSLERLEQKAKMLQRQMDQEDGTASGNFHQSKRGPRWGALNRDFLDATNRIAQIENKLFKAAELAEARDPSRSNRALAFDLGAPLGGMLAGYGAYAASGGAKKYRASVIAANRQANIFAAQAAAAMKLRPEARALTAARGITTAAAKNAAYGIASRFRPVAMVGAAVLGLEGLILRDARNRAQATAQNMDLSEVERAQASERAATLGAASMFMGFAATSYTASYLKTASLSTIRTSAKAAGGIESARSFLRAGTLHLAPKETARGALNSLTRAQLAEVARRRGVASTSALTKGQAATRITSHMNRMIGFGNSPITQAPPRVVAAPSVRPTVITPGQVQVMPRAASLPVQAPRAVAPNLVTRIGGAASRVAGAIAGGRGRMVVAGVAAMAALVGGAEYERQRSGRSSLFGFRAPSDSGSETSGARGSVGAGGDAGAKKLTYKNRDGEVKQFTKKQILSFEAKKK